MFDLSYFNTYNKGNLNKGGYILMGYSKEDYFKLVDRKRKYEAEIKEYNNTIDRLMWEAKNNKTILNLEIIVQNLQQELEGVRALMLLKRGEFSVDALHEMSKEYYETRMKA